MFLSFLYKKEQYAEVLDVTEKMFETILEKEDLRQRIDLDNSLIIYLAAANKIPTKETLDRSRKLIHKFSEKIQKDLHKSRLRLKQVMLYHLLCIKNNQLTEALEVISEFRTAHYEFLNAKAAVLIKLGKTEECIAVIDKIIEPSATNKATYVFSETVSGRLRFRVQIYDLDF